jgi:predicted transcriptional regulator
MYDDNTDLLSDSKEAIEWGEHLFDDVVKGSTKLDLKLFS